MTVAFCKSVARHICGLSRKGTTVRSDGDEGPDDGTNHIHPETVFHSDLRAERYSGPSI